MGKALEEVLKKELGFGDKRVGKFMEAYMAECAVTMEVLDPEVEDIGAPKLELIKIGYHAKQRYVERVVGLELLEDNMRLYIRDHEAQLCKEIQELYDRSTFLLNNSNHMYTPKLPKGSPRIKTTRGYYIVDNLVIAMDAPTGTMCTMFPVAFNLPKGLETAMINTITEEVIRMRKNVEQQESKIVGFQKQLEMRHAELIQQRDKIDQAITQCANELEEARTPIELHKQELYETARYLIDNQNYSEDELL